MKKRETYFQQIKHTSQDLSHGKARTRFLIQLGGLLAKSGLLEQLDIPMGIDLQKEDTYQEQIAILMGALLHLSQDFSSLPYALLKEKGLSALATKKEVRFSSSSKAPFEF